jgi:hypothetical protein
MMSAHVRPPDANKGQVFDISDPDRHSVIVGAETQVSEVRFDDDARNELRGGDIVAGRQRALQLFPTADELLARKKDHRRAEAALIALYGQHQFNRIPAQAGITARTYSGTSSQTA